MKPKELVLKYIQQAYTNVPKSTSPMDRDKYKSESKQHEIIQEMFDGMSTGTARIIIEQEMDQDTQEEFSIKQVENKGRYYTAKIVRPDGSVIQQLLVDKQSGTVQMIGC